MKILRLMMVFAVSSLLIFTACDSTDPSDDSKETEVKTTLAQLDATMGSMADLQSSKMLMALDGMPEGLLDLGFVLPKIVNSVTPYNLSKNSLNGRFFETLADTTIQDILDMLNMLYGTHTYIDGEWTFTDSPSSEIIIMYPFVDLNTGSEQDAKIRVHSISLAETAMSGNLEVYVDNVRQMRVELDAAGTDLFGETGVPSSVEISGDMLADNGITVNFGLTVTNTNIVVQIGVAGFPSLTLTVTADDLFDSINSDTGPVPTGLSMSYGEVELIINNFDVANAGDDMGDVKYSGNKVGEIIVEEAGIFIVFNNGNKADLLQLMPNAFALLESVPI